MPFSYKVLSCGWLITSGIWLKILLPLSCEIGRLIPVPCKHVAEWQFVLCWIAMFKHRWYRYLANAVRAVLGFKNLLPSEQTPLNAPSSADQSTRLTFWKSQLLSSADDSLDERSFLFESFLKAPTASAEASYHVANNFKWLASDFCDSSTI